MVAEWREDMAVYSTSKALYHKEAIADLRAGRQPNPTHVELIISDLCDHDCSFCAYRMSGYTSNELFQIEGGQSRKARNPNRQISKEKCFEIIDDCADMGVKALQFTGGGEPTIHPDFIEIVAYAQGKGLETALVTNGANLYRAEVREVVRKMAWVRVSVDAGTPETYCSIRNVPVRAWNRMREGVTALAAELKADGAQTVLGAGFVVTPENWKEVYQGTRNFKEWGFHNCRLGLMFNPDGSTPYDGFRFPMIQLADMAKEDFDEGIGRFRVINRTGEKMGELDHGNPDFSTCSYQQLTTYIGGDLNVYRCCVYAYSLRGVIGSLKEQRFKDLWASDAKQKDFHDFDARKCERCQFTEIIHTINAHVEDPAKPLPDGDPPTHHNFV